MSHTKIWGCAKYKRLSLRRDLQRVSYTKGTQQSARFTDSTKTGLPPETLHLISLSAL